MEAAAIRRFLDETYGPDAIYEAWREFTLGDEDAPSLDQAIKHHQLFLPWCFYCWSPGAVIETAIADRALLGDSPAQIFLAQHSTIDPARRCYLEACLDVRLTFHEILGGNDRAGFEVCDLLGGDRYQAVQLSHPLPTALKPSDIVYAQVVELDGWAKFEACATVAIPASHKLDMIARSCGAFRGLTPSQRALQDIKLRAIYFDLAGNVLAEGVPALKGQPAS